MFRLLAARILRPVKRVVLWLTGAREARSQMDQISTHLDRLDATLQDLSTYQRNTENQRRAEIIPVLNTLNEIVPSTVGLHGKLDGLYGRLDLLHADLYQLHEKVDHLHIRFSSILTGSTVREEIDRLDGYLIYHAEQLQSAMEALDGKTSHLAQEAAERLAAELDRLDGSILHHFAALRARLG
jgi:phosphoglycerate-specific signal transduction histidine kinase